MISGRVVSRHAANCKSPLESLPSTISPCSIGRVVKRLSKQSAPARVPVRNRTGHEAAGTRNKVSTT